MSLKYGTLCHIVLSVHLTLAPQAQRLDHIITYPVNGHGFLLSAVISSTLQQSHNLLVDFVSLPAISSSINYSQMDVAN